MLMELFWPKDLKKLVKKYKDEGTLNEVAMRNIEKTTYNHLAIIVIVALIFIFNAEYKIGVPLLIFSPLLAKFDLHRIFYNRFAPYVLGKRVEAMFVKIGSEGLGGGWRAIYKLPSKKRIVCNAGPRFGFEIQSWPKKNQMTHVYQSDIHKHKGMPDILFFKQNYSLTTSIL
jgi:hypothetical protein